MNITVPSATGASAVTGLEKFRDLHRGERCFVIGCAPSLQQLDLTRLRGEWAFTVNRGYLAARLGLPQTPYYVVGDPHTYRAYWSEIRQAAVGERFYRANVVTLPEYCGALDHEPAVSYPYFESPTMDEGHFAEDITAGAYRGFTVVLDAAQIAFFMGFAEVFILGCDLDYQGQQTHVYGSGDYEQKRRNDMPIPKVLQAMAVAAQAYSHRGRLLANAGVGGCLDTIPRVAYSSLFQSSSKHSALEVSPAEPQSVACSPRPASTSMARHPRFVSFLLPYIDRGQGPLFHWVMLMQAASFQPGELLMLGDDRYFHPPPPWAPLPWDTDVSECGYCFHFPAREAWDGIPKHSLPRSLFEELERRSGSMIEAFRILLTEDYPPLREALTRIFAEVCRAGKPEAVLTWCHVPSLKLAAAQFDIPVIHNELGPLRPPLYQGTVYFDFKSVNGLTSAAEEGARFCKEAGSWTEFQPLALEDIRALLACSPQAAIANHGAAQFKAGVALQVEDDSNMLAFAHGLNNFQAIFLARKTLRPHEILIRPHPRGYAAYSGRLGTMDDSPDAVAFLRKCEEVVTINSSVAFECLLQDKPVRVLGDSPAAGLSAEKLACLSEPDRLLWLNYLFLCYLVPAPFLFDAEYYRWRLSQPSLREIYQKHLHEFRRQKDRIKPWASIPVELWGETEAAARRAVAADPQAVDALRLLAGLAEVRRHFAEGAEHYRQIVKLHPEDIDAISGQAECSRKQGHAVLADMLFEEADQLRAKSAWPAQKESRDALKPAPSASPGSSLGLGSASVCDPDPVPPNPKRPSLLALLMEVPKQIIPPVAEFIQFVSQSFKDGRIEAQIGSEQHHRTFDAFERLGLHIYPLHYYSPLPDTTALHQNEPRWQKAYNLMDIAFNRPWEEELAGQFAMFREETKDLPCSVELQQQGWGPGYNDTDAMILYAMIRTTKPRRIIEVGSGVSTVFSTRAALRNLEDGVPTSVQCIEPFPSPPLQSLPGVEKLIVQEVQSVAPSFFNSLVSGDMLIIDTSHIVRLDGDVNFLYSEVLPFLNEGVLAHVHDIPFPYLCYAGKPVVYDWLMFWQEAYLLKAFLSHNRAFEVVFSASQMWHQRRDLLQQAFPGKSVDACPMSLWMHRHA